MRFETGRPVAPIPGGIELLIPASNGSGHRSGNLSIPENADPSSKEFEFASRLCHPLGHFSRFSLPQVDRISLCNIFGLKGCRESTDLSQSLKIAQGCAIAIALSLSSRRGLGQEWRPEDPGRGDWVYLLPPSPTPSQTDSILITTSYQVQVKHFQSQEARWKPDLSQYDNFINSGGSIDNRPVQGVPDSGPGASIGTFIV
ncbi:hypothetical protein EDB84DRAFT_1677053 [Lactarius hengduanensis]|nr:hypothetical protein EDB84DRAFT_1677053 [Lactarius hengduanensis]